MLARGPSWRGRRSPGRWSFQQTQVELSRGSGAMGKEAPGRVARGAAASVEATTRGRGRVERPPWCRVLQFLDTEVGSVRSAWADVGAAVVRVEVMELRQTDHDVSGGRDGLPGIRVLRVCAGQFAQLLRQREDHMEILRGHDPLPSLLEPSRLRQALTLRTVAISARIVGWRLVSAL